jgi:hypothetical protein
MRRTENLNKPNWELLGTIKNTTPQRNNYLLENLREQLAIDFHGFPQLVEWVSHLSNESMIAVLQLGFSEKAFVETITSGPTLSWFSVGPKIDPTSN